MPLRTDNLYPNDSIGATLDSVGRFEVCSADCADTWSLQDVLNFARYDC
jgi:hypothetical protein